MRALTGMIIQATRRCAALRKSFYYAGYWLNNPPGEQHKQLGGQARAAEAEWIRISGAVQRAHGCGIEGQRCGAVGNGGWQGCCGCGGARGVRGTRGYFSGPGRGRAAAAGAGRLSCLRGRMRCGRAGRGLGFTARASTCRMAAGRSARRGILWSGRRSGTSAA